MTIPHPHLRTGYHFIVGLRTAYGLILSIVYCVPFNNKTNIFVESTGTTILANVILFLGLHDSLRFFAQNDQFFSTITAPTPEY